MQKLNKDGTVEPFIWQSAPTDTPVAELGTGNWLVPANSFTQSSSGGLVIGPDDDLDALTDTIQQATVVAIDFPVFSDGRGFSIARLVREKLNYQGEIVAYGNFMQDQLHYLKRCGFDGFVVADDADVDSMRASLADFSDAYQASAENPLPLFRRRSA